MWRRDCNSVSKDTKVNDEQYGCFPLLYPDSYLDTDNPGIFNTSRREYSDTEERIALRHAPTIIHRSSEVKATGSVTTVAAKQARRQHQAFLRFALDPGTSARRKGRTGRRSDPCVVVSKCRGTVVQARTAQDCVLSVVLGEPVSRILSIDLLYCKTSP